MMTSQHDALRRSLKFKLKLILSENKILVKTIEDYIKQAEIVYRDTESLERIPTGVFKKAMARLETAYSACIKLILMASDLFEADKKPKLKQAKMSGSITQSFDDSSSGALSDSARTVDKDTVRRLASLERKFQTYLAERAQDAPVGPVGPKSPEAGAVGEPQLTGAELYHKMMTGKDEADLYVPSDPVIELRRFLYGLDCKAGDGFRDPRIVYSNERKRFPLETSPASSQQRSTQQPPQRFQPPPYCAAALLSENSEVGVHAGHNDFGGANPKCDRSGDDSGRGGGGGDDCGGAAASRAREDAGDVGVSAPQGGCEAGSQRDTQLPRGAATAGCEATLGGYADSKKTHRGHPVSSGAGGLMKRLSPPTRSHGQCARNVPLSDDDSTWPGKQIIQCTFRRFKNVCSPPQFLVHPSNTTISTVALSPMKTERHISPPENLPQAHRIMKGNQSNDEHTQKVRSRSAGKRPNTASNSKEGGKIGAVCKGNIKSSDVPQWQYQCAQAKDSGCKTKFEKDRNIDTPTSEADRVGKKTPGTLLGSGRDLENFRCELNGPAKRLQGKADLGVEQSLPSKNTDSKNCLNGEKEQSSQCNTQYILQRIDKMEEFLEQAILAERCLLTKCIEEFQVLVKGLNGSDEVHWLAQHDTTDHTQHGTTREEIGLAGGQIPEAMKDHDSGHPILLHPSEVSIKREDKSVATDRYPLKEGDGAPRMVNTGSGTRPVSKPKDSRSKHTPKRRPSSEGRAPERRRPTVESSQHCNEVSVQNEASACGKVSDKSCTANLPEINRTPNDAICPVVDGEQRHAEKLSQSRELSWETDLSTSSKTVKDNEQSSSNLDEGARRQQNQIDVTGLGTSEGSGVCGVPSPTCKAEMSKDKQTCASSSSKVKETRRAKDDLRYKTTEKKFEQIMKNLLSLVINRASSHLIKITKPVSPSYQSQVTEEPQCVGHNPVEVAKEGTAAEQWQTCPKSTSDDEQNPSPTVGDKKAQNDANQDVNLLDLTSPLIPNVFKDLSARPPVDPLYNTNPEIFNSSPCAVDENEAPCADSSAPLLKLNPGFLDSCVKPASFPVLQPIRNLSPGQKPYRRARFDTGSFSLTGHNPHTASMDEQFVGYKRQPPHQVPASVPAHLGKTAFNQEAFEHEGEASCMATGQQLPSSRPTHHTCDDPINTATGESEMGQEKYCSVFCDSKDSGVVNSIMGDTPSISPCFNHQFLEHRLTQSAQDFVDEQEIHSRPLFPQDCQSCKLPPRHSSENQNILMNGVDKRSQSTPRQWGCEVPYYRGQTGGQIVWENQETTCKDNQSTVYPPLNLQNVQPQQKHAGMDLHPHVSSAKPEFDIKGVQRATYAPKSKQNPLPQTQGTRGNSPRIEPFSVYGQPESRHRFHKSPPISSIGIQKCTFAPCRDQGTLWTTSPASGFKPFSGDPITNTATTNRGSFDQTPYNVPVNEARFYPEHLPVSGKSQGYSGCSVLPHTQSKVKKTRSRSALDSTRANTRPAAQPTCDSQKSNKNPETNKPPASSTREYSRRAVSQGPRGRGNPESRTVCITKLPAQLEEMRLLEVLNQHGYVSKIYFIKHRNTGAFQGTAYVKFRLQSEAESAVTALNALVLDGQPVSASLMSRND